MTSIFSKIVAGEIPAYKVYEDENFLAFLDVYPIAAGHTLVIPKKEIDNVFDLDDELYLKYQLVCKKIAKALAISISCVRVGSAVVGLEIPHAHIHLVPLNSIGDLNFEKPKLKFSEEEFRHMVQLIKSNL
ncbi:MAG: HIT domain-containing protein [Bacteroidetes bacterium]|nr:HIT domain-containing protein [Bacteroidota bacterium]